MIVILILLIFLSKLFIFLKIDQNIELVFKIVEHLLEV